MHCLGNFTGKEELGIPQDKEAVAKALQGINQLTRDGLLNTHVEQVFAFDQRRTCPRGGATGAAGLSRLARASAGALNRRQKNPRLHIGGEVRGLTSA